MEDLLGVGLEAVGAGGVSGGIVAENAGIVSGVRGIGTLYEHLPSSPWVRIA